MDRRKSLGLSPCTLDEIYSDLKAGGFRFETRDEANAKKGVYNNLTRGSGAVFFRLSNDKWGLMSWYPGVKRKKEDKDEKGDKGGAGGDQDDAGESQSAQSGTKENE